MGQKRVVSDGERVAILQAIPLALASRVEAGTLTGTQALFVLLCARALADHDGCFQRDDVLSLLEDIDPESFFDFRGCDRLINECNDQKVIADLLRKLRRAKQMTFYSDWISELLNQLLTAACVHAGFDMRATASLSKVGKSHRFVLRWHSHIRHTPSSGEETISIAQGPSVGRSTSVPIGVPPEPPQEIDEPNGLRDVQESVECFKHSSREVFAGIEPFDSTDSALDRFRQVCEARFPGSTEEALPPLKIRWLALGMAGASRTVVNLLGRLVKVETDREIEISIAMLDAGWKDLPLVSEQWSRSVGTNYANFVEFLRGFAAQTLQEKIPKVTARIWRYSYVPNWAGLVVDDSIYCITSCFCRKKVTNGHERVYVEGNVNDLVLIDTTSGTAGTSAAVQGAFASKIATVFDRWFLFACNGPFSTGPEIVVLGEAKESPPARRERHRHLPR
jgi:hypothetical protein